MRIRDDKQIREPNFFFATLQPEAPRSRCTKQLTVYQSARAYRETRIPTGARAYNAQVEKQGARVHFPGNRNTIKSCSLGGGFFKLMYSARVFLLVLSTNRCAGLFVRGIEITVGWSVVFAVELGS